MINLRAGDTQCDTACDGVYESLTKAGVEVLYDDRDGRPGVKFADADLIGLPWRLVIGPRGLKEDRVEVKRRDGTVDEETSLENAVARLIDANTTNKGG